MVSDVRLRAADHDFTLRIYPAAAPSGAVLVWAHGGGFAGGTLDMPEADAVAHGIADAGVSVVSVGYSLAPADLILAMIERDDRPGLPSRAQIEAEVAGSGPRVQFPVASLQIQAAFDWAVEHSSDLGGDRRRVGLGGASAGGNLVAGVALRLRDRDTDRPSNLLLAYPVLHAELSPPLVAGGIAADQFTPEAVRAMNLNYVGAAENLADPYAFPGGHRVDDLPTTLIVTAEHDQLRPSAEVFTGELARYGTDVAIVCERGASHGFLNEVGDPAAARTVARFADALRQL